MAVRGPSSNRPHPDPLLLPRSPRLWPTDPAPDIQGVPQGLLRRLRLHTNERWIADFGSDVGYWFRRYVVVQVLRLAAVWAVLSTVGFIAQGVSWSAFILALALALVLAGRAKLGVLASGVAIVLAGTDFWVSGLLIGVAVIYVRVMEAALRKSPQFRAWRPVTLIPRPEQYRLWRSRARFTMIVALDALDSGLPARARRSLNELLPVVREGMPACHAVVAQALAETDQRSSVNRTVFPAMLEARILADAAPPVVRAWVLSRQAKQMLELGDHGAAHELSQSAVPLVPRRHWDLSFSVSMIAAEAAARQDARPQVLQGLHAARLAAFKRRDLFGLVATEVGIMRHLRTSHADRSEIADYVHQLARLGDDGHELVPPRLIGVIESFVAEGALEMGQTQVGLEALARAAEAYQRSGERVEAALVSVRLARQLGQTGRRIGRYSTVKDQVQACLDTALDAIAVLDEVRYSLPTSQWRHSWVAGQVEVFQIALDAAHRLDSASVVAGLIEMCKAQAIPVERPVDRSEELAVLDAFLSDRTSLSGASSQMPALADNTDRVAAFMGADPLVPPPVPVVAGRPVLPKATQTDSAVEEIVAEVAGARARLLTAAVCADQYYWAYHVPGMGWDAGRISIAPGTPARQAVDQVLDMLPVRRPDERPRSYLSRLASSPLLDPAASSEEVAAAFQQAGRHLIPAPLVAHLSRTEANTAPSCSSRLVLSIPPQLSGIPYAFLGTRHGLGLDPQSTDPRLIDACDLQWAPSLTLLGSALDNRSWGTDSSALDPKWPINVAAAFALDGLANPGAPPDATCVVDTSVDSELRKEVIGTALRADGRGSMSTLFISGHMGSSSLVPSPLAVGLQLAEEDADNERSAAWLTVQDLLERGESDFPVPQRAIVCACSSLGLFEIPATLEAGEAARHRFRSSGAEWTGFTAALVLGGARHVIATQFDQVDLPEATALDHAMTDVLVNDTDPVSGFNRLVRSELEAWRAGRRPVAILPMCYAVVGVKADRHLGAPGDHVGLPATATHPSARDEFIPPAETAPLPPANWYSDPQGAARLRYWDGSRWTQHVAD